jgi:hypothetical protein
MAFGQNASVTRTLVCYPTVSGSTMLVEFRGSNFDVIALEVNVIPGLVLTLLDQLLNRIGAVPLSSLTTFVAGLASIPLLPTTVRYADANGIAHLIAPTAGLSAGDLVRVSGTIVA